MHNKFIVLLVVILSVLVFMITGCNKNTLEIEQASGDSNQPIEDSQETPISPTPSQESVQPAATPSDELPNEDTKSYNAEFYLEDDKIYMKSADEVTLFYDPSDHYDSDTTSAINTLIIDEDALFFKEWNDGAADYEDGYSCHSIVRLDKDGENRQVLVSSFTPFGYRDLISFQNRLIYLDECGDSYSIKDISKDGCDQDILDFDAYSASYDAYSGFGHVEFYKENDCLYAELRLYSMDDSSPIHTVCIDKDFNIERVLPEQDEYYIGGSKIYKNPAHTDGKVLIYDSNEFYSKDNSYVGYIHATGDLLYFMENGFNNKLGCTVSSIIQTDTNGSNRQLVYRSQSDMRMQPVFFDGRVYFACGHQEIDRIGYVEDGNCIDYICFRGYANQLGFSNSDYINVRLSIEDDRLIATLGFDYSRVTHVLKINEDLTYELISVS